MSKRKVPKNTEKTSKWAMTNMTEWLNDYNSRNTDAKCPDEFLTPSCSKENLCKWLCVFVNETRAKNGAPYPPKTLQCLLAGILRHMRETNPNYPNFFSKEDPDFTSFHITLDNLFKSLRADGIGTESSLTSQFQGKKRTSCGLLVSLTFLLLKASFIVSFSIMENAFV